ncbi:MAG: 6TM ABC transporter family protein [Armatimonadota bacterium]
MTEPDARFQAIFQPFRRRIQRLLVERGICWGLTAAGLLASLLLLIGLFTSWDITPLGLLLLLLLGAAGGGVAAQFRRRSDLAFALTLERRADLKERVSTAIVLQDDAASDPEFRALVTEDALAHLESLTPKTLFPRTLARSQKTALLAWGIVLLLFVLPTFDWLYPRPVREQRLALREAGKVLQKQAKDLQERPETRNSDVARQVARNMKKLGIDLQKNRISPRRALMKMHKLEEQARKASRDLADAQAKRDNAATKQAADQARKALANRSAAEKAAAERAREKLAESGDRKQLTPEERNALSREERLSSLAEHLEAGDLGAAAEDLNQLGEDLESAELSEAERAQLAENLEQLSEALQNSSGKQLSAAMKKAAGELQKGTPEGHQQAAAALQDVGDPSETPSAAQQMAAAQGQVSQARQCLAGKCSGRQGMAGKAGNGNAGQGPQPKDRINSRSGFNPQSNGGPGGTGPGSGGLGPDQLPHPSGQRRGAGLHSGQIDPNARQSTAYSIDVRGGPDSTTQTNVPYYDVYQDYRRSAEQAVESDQYPPDERRRVKAYFDALDPARR